MKKAKEEFEKRRLEIEEYFTFLKKLDYDSPKLIYSKLGTPETYKVNDELVKILKANGFLLIYNLVEAVTRISLIELLVSITNSKTKFNKLSDELQKLWILNKRFADKELKNKPEERVFHELYNEIISNAIIDFTLEIKDSKGEILKEFVSLSGNVDARQIRTIAEKYGFNSKLTSSHEKAGADLQEVKTKRNYLAHGRITFIECGKDFSVSQMCGYKDNSLIYLENILINIEKFVKEKKFKRKQ